MSEHAAEITRTPNDAAEYVKAMSDVELALMLDSATRCSDGRCVTPRILRAASEEVARRG